MKVQLTAESARRLSSRLKAGDVVKLESVRNHPALGVQVADVRADDGRMIARSVPMSVFRKVKP